MNSLMRFSSLLVLSLFYLPLIAQLTTSHVFYNAPELGVKGTEIHRQGDDYLILADGQYVHRIDPISLEQTSILDLAPYQSYSRGPALISEEDHFYLGIAEPYRGVVKMDYDGNLLAGFDLEIDAYLGGGIWRANDSTLVFAMIDYHIYNNSWLIWLDNDLHEIRRLNLPIAFDDQGTFLTHTEYFYELDANHFILGQTGVFDLCLNSSSFPYDCGNGPVYVRKMNLNGETLWRYHSDTVSGITAITQANQVIHSETGETYIACEDETLRANQPLHRLLKIDSSGQQLWQEAFPSPINQYSADLAFSPEGDIIGLVNLDLEYWDPDTGETFYKSSAYLYKLRPDNEVLWKRHLVDSTYLFSNGDTEQQLHDIFVEPDGSIVLVGSIVVPPEFDVGTGLRHIWLLRLNEEGCLTPDCNEFRLTDIDELLAASPAYTVEQLRVFPNPAGEQFTLAWPEGRADSRLDAGQLRLLDPLGRVVLRTSGAVRLPYTFSELELPSGWYVAEWVGEDGRVARGKVVVR